jgi:hypothetical protein
MTVKRRTLLTLLAILTLCLLSCSLVDQFTSQKPSEATAPPPAGSGDEPPSSTPKPPSDTDEQPTPTPKPASQEPTATPQPAAEQPTPTTAPPSDTEADLGLGGLNSYRIYATQQEEGSDQVVEFTAEAVLEPFAFHSTVKSEGKAGMEIIIVGRAMWTKMAMMGSDAWHRTDLTDEELSDWENLMDQAQASGELPDIPPWPRDIRFLPGQVPLPLVEGGLTPAGAEAVNGVQCRKYTFDTEYSYSMELPDPLGKVDTTVQGTGTIWVADQSGFPPIVMQAQAQKTETNKTSQGETTTITHIEHQVTGINVPITIEPPE